MDSTRKFFDNKFRLWYSSKEQWNILGFITVQVNIDSDLRQMLSTGAWVLLHVPKMSQYKLLTKKKKDWCDTMYSEKVWKSEKGKVHIFSSLDLKESVSFYHLFVSAFVVFKL